MATTTATPGYWDNGSWFPGDPPKPCPCAPALAWPPPDYLPELRRIADALEKLAALVGNVAGPPVRSRRLGDDPDYVTEA
jgi:hypothetical protein